LSKLLLLLSIIWDLYVSLLHQSGHLYVAGGFVLRKNN